MAIIRKKRKEKFYVMPMEVANDERLGMEEMGLLVYLLSRPDNWKVQPTQLQKRFGVGRDKLRRVMLILKDFGYVEVKQMKTNGQFSHNNWTVFEYRTPLTENELTENPPLNKDLSLINTDKQILIPYDDVKESYNRWCTELPKVVTLTDKRKKQVAKLWQSDERHRDIKFWDQYFHHCNCEPFFLGENDRGWKASFDYLTREDVFVRNIEKFIADGK